MAEVIVEYDPESAILKESNTFNFGTRRSFLHG